MRGKIVFITGASSGIGEGCARKFASQGSDVILNARNVAKLEELKKELEKAYDIRVFLLPFDVRDRKAAVDALASLPENWKAIDVLVSAYAGLHPGSGRRSRHDVAGCAYPAERERSQPVVPPLLP